MADKQEIVNAWLSGEYTTYASLARKLGVSREYIRKVVDDFLKEQGEGDTEREKVAGEEAQERASL